MENGEEQQGLQVWHQSPSAEATNDQALSQGLQKSKELHLPDEQLQQKVAEQKRQAGEQNLIALRQNSIAYIDNYKAIVDNRKKLQALKDAGQECPDADKIKERVQNEFMSLQEEKNKLDAELLKIYNDNEYSDNERADYGRSR